MAVPPQLSAHFASRVSSPIREAQQLFSQRTDGTEDINVAIGNVSLPMHPKMLERMYNLKSASVFADGVVKYSSTLGFEEANRAVLNIISASGVDTSALHSQIVDGGSHGMELVALGCCGPAGTGEKPLMLIDAAYSNYGSMVQRIGRSKVSVTRMLGDDGCFQLPDLNEIEAVIQKTRPGAMVVIPYDNPTGQLLTYAAYCSLARLCVKYGMWLVSDEAYRELHYSDTVESATSVWALSEADVPGITGRRIGIETASKVWNACGLRIGAVVTDNAEFHAKCVFENTANLCAPVISQHIFGALAEVSKSELQGWFQRQRDYYGPIAKSLHAGFQQHLPGAIVSSPDASLYMVVDVRNIASAGFKSKDFVTYCATTGRVPRANGKFQTILVSPMSGFYPADLTPNPGDSQMRIAFVQSPEKMELVPELFAALLGDFESTRLNKSKL